MSYWATSSRADVTYTELLSLTKPSGFDSYHPNSLAPNASGWQLTVNGAGRVTGNQLHTFLYSNVSADPIDLTPSEFASSIAGTNGTTQFGWVVSPASTSHAGYWTGSAQTFVDLNPAGVESSSCVSGFGTQQVGDAAVPISPASIAGHAMLWTGSAASAVDLHPAGFTRSTAIGTNGVQQVGYGLPEVAGSEHHALIWSGSANSVVDLHPVGFDRSEAIGVGGGQQVGSGSVGFPVEHALLWAGLANSVVDLTPSDFNSASAVATDGVHQVGSGNRFTAIDHSHALVWRGSSQRYIDLNYSLPYNYVDSWAWSIVGNSVYGYAKDTDENYHAIVWTIPEPVSSGVIGMVAVAYSRRRRRLS
jgi:hypothetical protein